MSFFQCVVALGLMVLAVFFAGFWGYAMRGNEPAASRVGFWLAVIFATLALVTAATPS